MASVLLVDDHPIIVSTVALQISEHWPNTRVRAEASLAGGLRALRQDKFDLAVLDLTLPDSVGVENIHALLRIAPMLDVLVFTGLIQPNVELACIRAGAFAFVTKAEQSDSLVKALARRLGRTDSPGKPGAVQELTLRQRQVLRCLLNGHSVKQISAALEIAESTVQTHVKAINQIGGCRNRVDLMRWAQSIGFDSHALSTFK